MRSVLTSVVLMSVGGCSTPAEAPPAPAPKLTPKAAAPTDAERRARFDSRAALVVSADLPAPWRRLLKILDARLLKLDYATYAHQTDWRGGVRIGLTFRVFGRDGEVDARTHAALALLKLPKLSPSLNAQSVKAGSIIWSVDVDRVVAPAGSARETQIELRWERRPKGAAERGRCRKPHETAARVQFPGWLRQATEKRTTRRRIFSQIKAQPRESEAHVQMLYRNGVAHDENVGQVTAAAKKAGFSYVEGAGPNQRWRHHNHAQLVLRSVRDPHDMGCELRGPVLGISWRGPNNKNRRSP